MEIHPVRGYSRFYRRSHARATSTSMCKCTLCCMMKRPESATLVSLNSYTISTALLMTIFGVIPT